MILATALGTEERIEAARQLNVQPFLRTIESIALRATTLCQQMLAYAGQGRFRTDALDLSIVVSEALRLPDAAARRQASVALDLAAGLPPVRGDRVQLRQIVLNLGINAYEAIGEKPGRVRIATGVMRADRATLASAVQSPGFLAGDYVFLEIADTGCGMSAETRSKIFDPFFSTKFTGRGLGLAAVLGIVRCHGGALLVDSAPEAGATFRLLLPPAAVASALENL